MTAPDLQKLFDKSFKTLVKQGGPSKGHLSVGCVYKAEDGRKCAVGAILTEEELKKIPPEFNGRGIAILLCEDFLSKSYRPIVTFLQRLQGAHDHAITKGDAWDLESLAGCFRHVAKQYNLSEKVLPKQKAKARKMFSKK